MRHTRTILSGIATVALVVSLGACRGDEDSAGDDASDDAAASEESDDAAEESDDAADASDDAAEGSDGDAAAADESDDAAEADGGSASGVDCPAESPGLTDTSIKLGGTYPLSGAAAAYGVIPGGVGAWFDYLNDTQGGFQLQDGRTVEIEWEVVDDAYEPTRALDNVRRLVEQEDVFLVLNPLGTPNNMAIRSYMNENEIPQLFVATGASAWGNGIEEFPWTIGWQPDYASEGVAYATYVLEQNPDAQIGVLYQNDDFGEDYLGAIEETVGEDRADQLQAVSYEITDASVDTQVSQLADSDVDAFISITTPAKAVQTIQRVRSIGWEPDIFILTSVSASVAAVLEPAGLDNSEGIITSNYLKDPTDPAQADDPALVEYREILGEYSPDSNPDDAFNVYGMNLAQGFQALIEGMEGDICRASIMEAAKNFSWTPNLTVDGIEVHTSPDDSFPITQVQLQEFQDGGWVKFGEILDSRDVNGEG